MKANELLEEVVEAHGGRAHWQTVRDIEASLSSGGLAFTAHGQPFALRNLKVSVSPHERRVVLTHFCGMHWRGVWTPNHVEIRDSENRLIDERRDPRRFFGSLVKTVKWDKLDILYFAGYALWNYLSFPFILSQPGVAISEIASPGNSGALRLEALFDASLPTRSARQTFHIDTKRHLTRHDYTADVIGPWATAANCCLASERVAGLRFYTRRKVYPRIGRGNGVMPFPTLVWIEIDDLNVNFTVAPKVNG
jgi:hypothetical protein